MVGYTCGVFDVFHVGHLNILRAAKGLCDTLIVGVTVESDKQPIIPFDERIEVVRAIKHVDVAIPQYNHDKVEAHNRLKYDKLFVGDDWYNSDTWKQYEAELSKRGVEVVYLPYTKQTSSTLIRGKHADKR